MPTKTFFNLQDEKKNKIIEASKNEFSRYSFYDASINRIIKEAGISRGSFYQYFDNKEDLFIYILDDYKNIIIQWIKEKVKDNKYDIFELLLLVYDYVTDAKIGEKDKQLLITIISNMDIKLTQHLMSFLKIEEINDKCSDFTMLVDMSKLRIKEEEEIMMLHNVLMNIMMNQIALFFSKNEDSSKCKEDLIKQFNLVKYGVIES